jgi:hypothetical protein
MAKSDNDRVVRYGLTIGAAVSITAIVLLTLYYIPQINGIPAYLITFIKWTLVPAIGYCIALGFNALMQNISCNNVKIGHIALLSTFTPIAIIVGLLITSFLPFLLYPIRAAAPQFSPNTVDGISVAFVTFWGSLYSQIISSTFASTCIQSNNDVLKVKNIPNLDDIKNMRNNINQIGTNINTKLDTSI